MPPYRLARMASGMPPDAGVGWGGAAEQSGGVPLPAKAAAARANQCSVADLGFLSRVFPKKIVHLNIQVQVHNSIDERYMLFK